MSNNQFIQRLIDQNQQKVDLYSRLVIDAEGDRHQELKSRINHHQNEVNNYKELQEQLT